MLEAGRAGPAAEGGPWHYAISVDHAGQAGNAWGGEVRQVRRDDRWELLRTLWDVSGYERVRKCRRARANEAGNVGVVDNAGVAHFTGLTTCGSIHMCPHCSAHIRAERSEEISRGVANWIKLGGGVLMLSGTLPHDMDDRLDDSFDTIVQAWRAVQRSKGWRALKDDLGFVGKIRVFEVTHRWVHGWHPHLHALLLFDGDLDAEQYTRLLLLLRKEWRRFITKRGYRPPSDQHGIDLQRCHSAVEAAEYIAKTQDGKSVGNEMTRADLKTGRAGSRTPFQILRDFRDTGNMADLGLWREYEDATHGRKAMEWDPGLRKRVQIDEEERSGEEITGEEIGGQTVAVIPGGDWVQLTRHAGLPATVLRIAERDGLAGVTDLLARFGLRALPPPDLDSG